MTKDSSPREVPGIAPENLTDKLIATHIKHLEEMTWLSGYDRARLSMLRELQVYRSSPTREEIRREAFEEAAKVARDRARRQRASSFETTATYAAATAEAGHIESLIRALSPQPRGTES